MNSEKQVIENKLAHLPIRKLLWEYSLPAIVGTMVSSLYNVIDRIFIGQGVGTLAISGLALTFPFMNFLIAFGMLVGAGAATRVSISLGENDHEKANKILANATILLFLLMTLVIIIARVFMTDILMLLGGSEKTIAYAEDFMSIIIPAMLIGTFNYSLNNIMRASGYPKKAMLTMFISAGTNVILAPLFIFGFKWGIKGAALATSIAMTVSCVWVILHFLKKNSVIRFKKEYFKLDKEIVKSILDIGMSPFSMQIAMSGVILIINRSLIKYGGDLAVGAYGIFVSVTMLIVMFIIGLNQGAQPILGFNFGARNYERMFHALKTTAIVATVISTFGFFIGVFFPTAIISVFTPDKELQNIAANGLRITVLMFPLIGSQIVFTNFFQSIGKAKISMFLSLTRQVLFLIPCLFLLPPFLGLNGVWFSMPASDALSTIVTTTTLILFIRKFKTHNS
ncbi:MATE efflux family protein [uncultured Paludibacter sp.]|nr:MATE efflux family protein [uncultured Paludibacter sp.]